MSQSEQYFFNYFFYSKNDLFFNILNYPLSYNGIKRVFINLLKQLVRLKYITRKNNSYSFEAFKNAVEYAKQKKITTFLKDFENINKTNNYGMDDYFKGQKYIKSEEIIETAGNTNGESGKVAFENKAEFLANNNEYIPSLNAYIKSRDLGVIDKERGLTQLKICSLVSIFGDGKALRTHAQYTKGLTDLKIQSLEYI